MDLGIGYITLSHERLSQVDFLSWMGQLEFVMVSARPKAVQSYTTLVRPLDMHSWCFLAGSSLMMVTMLYCIYWTASLKKSLHRGWSPTKSVRLDYQRNVQELTLSRLSSMDDAHLISVEGICP